MTSRGGLYAMVFVTMLASMSSCARTCDIKDDVKRVQHELRAVKDLQVAQALSGSTLEVTTLREVEQRGEYKPEPIIVTLFPF